MKFYRVSWGRSKKGACAPGLLSQTGFEPVELYAAAFFLPITLPMTGQKSSNKAIEVIAATK